MNDRFIETENAGPRLDFERGTTVEQAAEQIESALYDEQVDDGYEEASPPAKQDKPASIEDRISAVYEREEAEQPTQAEQKSEPVLEIPDVQQLHAQLVLHAQQVDAKYAAIDWNRLRQENPAEWTALNQERERYSAYFQQQNAQLQALAGQAQERAQQAAAQQAHAAHIAKERAELNRLVPEYADDAVYAREAPQILDYLRRAGVPEARISDMTAAEVAQYRKLAIRRTPRPNPQRDVEREIRKIGARPHSVDAAAVKIGRMFGGA